MDDNSNNSNMLDLSSAADSKWVEQNVQGVMLKIIEEVKGLVTKEADISHINRPDLIALIQDFNQKHQFLDSQCDILFEILRGNVSPTTEDKKPIMLSPKAKGMPKFEGHTITFDSPPSSGSSRSSIETSLLSSDFEIESFTLSGVQKHSNSKLDDSDEAMDEQKLSSSLEIGFLVLKIAKYEEEIAALKDSVRNSDTENAQLVALLESRYAESEKKIKSLENELKKCESIKAEMKDFYHTQDIQWHNITQSLKTELNDLNKNFDEMKDFHQTQDMQWHNITQSLKTELNDLNKNFEVLKLKYDTQLSEKDNLNAKLQTLNTDLCSKDMKIRLAESELHQLQKQHTELNTSFDKIFKEKDDLELKVEELKKELKEQAVMISDRAEEKREAIRQLCFSLEHYRSGYNELHKVYIGHRRLAMAAK